MRTATAETAKAIRQEGAATGRLPLGQGPVDQRTLEVAASPAEMGLDAGALVEVNGQRTTLHHFLWQLQLDAGTLRLRAVMCRVV